MSITEKLVAYALILAWMFIFGILPLTQPDKLLNWFGRGNFLLLPPFLRKKFVSHTQPYELTKNGIIYWKIIGTICLLFGLFGLVAVTFNGFRQ